MRAVAPASAEAGCGCPLGDGDCRSPRWPSRVTRPLDGISRGRLTSAELVGLRNQTAFTNAQTDRRVCGYNRTLLRSRYMQWPPWGLARR